MEHLDPAAPGTRQAMLPGPLRIDGADKYVIDEIISQKMVSEHPMFEVRWLGYAETTTWERYASLRTDGSRLLEDYQKQHQAAGTSS